MTDRRRPEPQSPPARTPVDEARRRFLRQVESLAAYDPPTVSAIPLADDEPAGGDTTRPRRG